MISRSLTIAALVVAVAGSAAAQGSKGPAGRIAADVIGTFLCTAVEKGGCIGPTDTFATTTPVVHVVYRTKELPRSGDFYLIQWIAEDVGQAAPPNTLIVESRHEVGNVRQGMDMTVSAHVSRPNNGWPTGRYRVEIKLVDRPVTTARFAVR